ncbi:hypothetical protein KHC28_00880 [Ancylobacter sonchi]|uniref:hypothetical protein n=1 Tax=Ancylobacter sonchi TaxID=1937790 RepID=UPI001BD46747|nr:hypothetical protein [Ancylobacter sonchi]MBS7532218.1 hypothetical protein [Ancylobacter sonchi]
MLINIEKRTIYIAGLKTASTTIENGFRGEADIRLTRSEHGKHMSLAEIEENFAWLFNEIALEDFFIWGIVRNPISWLWSLYCSHKAKWATGTDLSTNNIDFRQFYDEWRVKHADQAQPQLSRFARASGKTANCILIPFENLTAGMAGMARLYDQPVPAHKILNKSPDIPIRHDQIAPLMSRICRDYDADFEAHEEASGNIDILRQRIDRHINVLRTSNPQMNTNKKSNSLIYIFTSANKIRPFRRPTS